jgi:hypothetical protein
MKYFIEVVGAENLAADFAQALAFSRRGNVLCGLLFWKRRQWWQSRHRSDLDRASRKVRYEVYVPPLIGVQKITP